MHTTIDDYSRVAYAEVHDDETALTGTTILTRAVGWFAARGVTVERVLSDNGAAYRSKQRATVREQLPITPKKTRPYRPQTNGKIERFYRTLADGWAHARCHESEHAHHNHHKPHTTIWASPQIVDTFRLRGLFHG